MKIGSCIYTNNLILSVATTFSLPEIESIMLASKVLRKNKKEVKMTSCLRWLPLLFKVAAQLNLFVD